jgi:hypothetical protein
MTLPFSRRQVFPEANGENLTFQGTFHNPLERSMNALAGIRHHKMVRPSYCNAWWGFSITFETGLSGLGYRSANRRERLGDEIPPDLPTMLAEWRRKVTWALRPPSSAPCLSEVFRSRLQSGLMGGDQTTSSDNGSGSIGRKRHWSGAMMPLVVATCLIHRKASSLYRF